MGKGRPRLYDIEAILRDWLAGMSTGELTAKYGCPPNKGALLAKKRGLTRSPAVKKMANARRAQLKIAAEKASPVGKQREKKSLRIADYVKRHGIKSAVAKFGILDSTARTIARRYGWRPEARYDRKAILREYLAGASLSSLAAKHGCGYTVPSHLARSAGVKRDKSLALSNLKRPRKK